MFPINMHKRKLVHKGGMKEYHTVILLTDDDRALVIRRWCKVKSWGQMEVECFSDREVGSNAFFAKIEEKSKRGYVVDPGISHEVLDLSDLKRILGAQYWAQLGPENAEWLIPGVDTTGIKAPPMATWEKTDKTGRYKRVEPPLLTIEQPPPREPTIDERVAQNPNWGMF